MAFGNVSTVKMHTLNEFFPVFSVFLFFWHALALFFPFFFFLFNFHSLSLSLSLAALPNTNCTKSHSNHIHSKNIASIVRKKSFNSALFFSLSLSRSMKARTLDVSTKSTWINYNVFVNPVIWDTFLFVCLNLRLRRTWFPRRDLIQIGCAAGDVMFVSLFEINWTEFECRNRNYIDWAEEQNLLGNISNGQAQRKPNVKGEMVEFFFNPTFIRFFCCISEWIALRKTCLV